MRKFVILTITILFCFIFCISSLAVNYTPYASVTASTSNISMLIETMFNQTDFNPFKDWVAIRVGQYDYSLFYNIDSGNCTRLRYYGVTQQYITDWYLTKTNESNFSFYRGQYTVVGNTEECLGSTAYRDYIYQFILTLSVPAIVIVFLFFTFRIRKKGVINL